MCKILVISWLLLPALNVHPSLRGFCKFQISYLVQLFNWCYVQVVHCHSWVYLWTSELTFYKISSIMLYFQGYMLTIKGKMLIASVRCTNWLSLVALCGFLLWCFFLIAIRGSQFWNQLQQEAYTLMHKHLDEGARPK